MSSSSLDIWQVYRCQYLQHMFTHIFVNIFSQYIFSISFHTLASMHLKYVSHLFRSFDQARVRAYHHLEISYKILDFFFLTNLLHNNCIISMGWWCYYKPTLLSIFMNYESSGIPQKIVIEQLRILGSGKESLVNICRAFSLPFNQLLHNVQLV